MSRELQFRQMFTGDMALAFERPPTRLTYDAERRKANLFATLGDADDVVKAWVKTESGQLLDVEINQASSLTLQGWHICGEFGSAIREGDTFKVQFYDPAEAAPLEIIEGAAPERRYDNLDRLPWQVREFPITKDKQRDFYANIHDVLTNNAEPYVPIEESRELMRVLELCREGANF